MDILSIYQSKARIFFLFLYYADGWYRSFVYTFFSQYACIRFGYSFSLRLKCCWPPLFTQGIDLNHWNRCCEPINIFAFFTLCTHNANTGDKIFHSIAVDFGDTYSIHVLTHHFHFSGVAKDVAGINENIYIEYVCNLVFNFHAKLSLKYMLHTHLFYW